MISVWECRASLRGLRDRLSALVRSPSPAFSLYLFLSTSKAPARLANPRAGGSQNAGDTMGCTSRPVVYAAFTAFVCVAGWMTLMFFELLEHLE